MQGDTKLRGLSEYVVGFKKIYFYNDNKLERNDIVRAG